MMVATIRPPAQYDLFPVAFLPWLAVGCVLLWALIRLRETTLAWPIVWCVAGWCVFSFALLASPHWATDFPDYVASVTLITPTLAVLGAKRPQNGAWQFIVITLVGVLLFPVLKGYAFGDYRTQVPVLFRWLIAAHIFIGIVNYLPTRYALPVSFFGIAQYFICRRYLPFSDGPHWNDYRYAWPCLIVAILWAGWSAEFDRAAVAAPSLNRLWLDFRDAYGLVWGLRVAERLNVSATKHGWPVEFKWGGIVMKTESGELPADVEHRVERELRSMLRRFVSHDWIARRLHDVSASSSTAGGAGGGN